MTVLQIDHFLILPTYTHIPKASGKATFKKVRIFQYEHFESILIEIKKDECFHLCINFLIPETFELKRIKIALMIS